jgi:hypothetical protein
MDAHATLKKETPSYVLLLAWFGVGEHNYCVHKIFREKGQFAYLYLHALTCICTETGMYLNPYFIKN